MAEYSTERERLGGGDNQRCYLVSCRVSWEFYDGATARPRGCHMTTLNTADRHGQALPPESQSAAASIPEPMLKGNR
jgi:hypothetical protein